MRHGPARPPAVAVAPVGAHGHRGYGEVRPAAPRPGREATGTGRPGRRCLVRVVTLPPAVEDGLDSPDL